MGLTATPAFVAPSEARADDTAEATKKDDYTTRRERLAQMSPAEKEELRRKLKRFDQLAPKEQERIRTLHEKLHKDPQATRLERIMRRYHEWLKTLTPTQRAELAELSGNDRIEFIKKIRQEQEAEQLREIVKTKLRREDIRLLFTWMGKYTKQHEAELLALLSPDAKRRIERMRNSNMRRWYLLKAASRKRNGHKLPTPTDEELSSLLTKLSDEARKAMETQPDADSQFQLARQWAQAAMMSRFMPKVSPKQLEKFYTEQLNSKQREYLESLPRQRMEQELRRLYYKHHAQRHRDQWRRKHAAGHPPNGNPKHRRPESRRQPPPPSGAEPPEKGPRDKPPGDKPPRQEPPGGPPPPA